MKNINCFEYQSQDGLGHQPFSCKSLHVLKSSSSHQKYTEDNHNGSTKYGHNADDELNPTYHCCNSAN